MKPSDRYLKMIEWSEEDQCYIGRCPGLMMGGVHGSSQESVYHELCVAVDEWIRIHEEDGAALPPATAGKSYSGKFVLRIDSTLHEKLSLKALADGDSLNNFCRKQLEQAISA